MATWYWQGGNVGWSSNLTLWTNAADGSGDNPLAAPWTTVDTAGDDISPGDNWSGDPVLDFDPGNSGFDITGNCFLATLIASDPHDIYSGIFNGTSISVRTIYGGNFYDLGNAAIISATISGGYGTVGTLQAVNFTDGAWTANIGGYVTGTLSGGDLSYNGSSPFNIESMTGGLLTPSGTFVTTINFFSGGTINGNSLIITGGISGGTLNTVGLVPVGGNAIPITGGVFTGCVVSLYAGSFTFAISAGEFYDCYFSTDNAGSLNGSPFLSYSGNPAVKLTDLASAQNVRSGVTNGPYTGTYLGDNVMSSPIIATVQASPAPTRNRCKVTVDSGSVGNHLRGCSVTITSGNFKLDSTLVVNADAGSNILEFSPGFMNPLSPGDTLEISRVLPTHTMPRRGA